MNNCQIRDTSFLKNTDFSCSYQIRPFNRKLPDTSSFIWLSFLERTCLARYVLSIKHSRFFIPDTSFNAIYSNYKLFQLHITLIIWISFYRVLRAETFGTNISIFDIFPDTSFLKKGSIVSRKRIVRGMSYIENIFRGEGREGCSFLLRNWYYARFSTI